MDLKALITDVNNLVLQGKAMDAFEKYYADDIIMRENDNPPTKGKDANRQRELEFFGNVTEFRGAEVKSVAVGDNVTMVEWHFDYTHKEWGDRNYHQVAVQNWKDGKIVSETFYYGT